MSMMNTCAVKPPGEAFKMLADKGADTTKYSSGLVFAQSFYAGCYIGFGALLATKISASMPGMTEDNPGFQSFVFAALFPVNLLLILLTGGILFTGTSAACPAAVYEGKIKIKDAARCLAISWVGNVLGSLVFAYFTQYCQLLEGATAASAIKIMEKKVSKDFMTTFLKGIGCNWMVCMAVFLCGQAQDMCGKYLGIWFPISTFVMIGFEHIPANFYLMLIGLLADGSDVTFWDVLVKNWIPVTLGNFAAGAFIVAGGYSFMFGRLGSLAAERFQPKQPAQEADVEKPEPILPNEKEDLKKENADEAGNSKSQLPARSNSKENKTNGKSDTLFATGTTWDRCVSEGSIQGL
jgi:formate/nitrite transporter